MRRVRAEDRERRHDIKAKKINRWYNIHEFVALTVRVKYIFARYEMILATVSKTNRDTFLCIHVHLLQNCLIVPMLSDQHNEPVWIG